MPLYNNVIRKINEADDPKDENKLGYEFWEGVEELPVIKQIGQYNEWSDKNREALQITKEEAKSLRKGEKGRIRQALQYLNDTLGVVEDVVSAPFDLVGHIYNTGVEALSDSTNVDRRTIDTTIGTMLTLSKVKGSKTTAFKRGANLKSNLKGLKRKASNIGKPASQQVIDTNTILNMHPTEYGRVLAIYRNHEGGISWKQAMERARLPSWENRTVYIPPEERIGTQKGDPLQSTIDTVPPVVRRTMAWESGLKDGVFDFDIWKSKELRGKTYRSRLTASMIQTAHKEGISFEAYRDNIVMPAFKKEWQPILKKLDIDPSNLELHHIGAIKASVGLYDGLQYGSPEWNSVTEALLERYVKLGDVPDNLIPVVGSRTDIGTPHYIAHKYLDDIIGPIGEKFFTPEIRRQMKSSLTERIRIANEYADVVKKSEQIVVQAQEIWDLSYKGDIPESLVEKLMANPAIFDETYQPPQLRNMVQTAIDDLDLNPLEQGIPNALTDVFERIDAGQNMILDLINDPKLTSRKAIQRYNIKDPRNKQLVLKLVKSVQNLTPQQVQRIMQEYGKGGKGGIPISYNIDDIFPV